MGSEHTDRPLTAPVEALVLTLLVEGRHWSPEKTQEFVEAARAIRDLLSPRKLADV